MVGDRAMKSRKVIAGVLLLLVVVAGAALLIRGRQTKLVLAATTVGSGGVTVRVTKFEQTWSIYKGSSRMPPPWMMEYPFLLKGWAMLFRYNEKVMDGLVWFVVDATVSSDQPVQPEDIDFRLDYGKYTIGANGRRSLIAPPRPLEVGTRFEVTEGNIPVALEIQVKGEWLRFPIIAQ